MNEDNVDKELRNLRVGLTVAGGVLVVGFLTIYARHTRAINLMLASNLDKMLDAHINTLNAYTKN